MLRLEASARGHPDHVTVAVDDVGHVPVQNHDATVDELVLGTGRHYRVLISPTSRGRAKSANVLVDGSLKLRMRRKRSYGRETIFYE